MKRRSRRRQSPRGRTAKACRIKIEGDGQPDAGLKDDLQPKRSSPCANKSKLGNVGEQGGKKEIAGGGKATAISTQGDDPLTSTCEKRDSDDPESGEEQTRVEAPFA